MLGKNHLITNTASLVILSTGTLALSNQSSDTPFGALAPAARTVISAFTHYGDTPWITIGAGLLLFYLGSLLPDIDSAHSMLGRHLHLPVKHRTWTHAIWIPLILFVAGFAFPPLWWVTLGYVLHLFWDGLSRGGVCWFYPISQYREYSNGAKVKKHHWLKLYSVGGFSENVVVTSIVILAFVCVYFYVHNFVFVA